MYVGKLIDIIDYMSKWRNSIVKKVDKKIESITVFMESGLEAELTKNDIVSLMLFNWFRISKVMK